ncbi:glycosyltransferase family 4 protein [Pukyongiella litopenaei]|uniref:Glycosyltransferase family 4 protein n=1 Tax=Pukyongiella litopenaei TaxID=2605946 RepID=A0A2S0MMP3_9RHOB|nr:glycosyltransferase family 4 protein [Pukyongiella litopenaei]AVO37097.1 glycosyltransferase family 4 protein [Pukyongiella litopenaei]
MEPERLTILYIARSAFGIMGEAAISNYVRVMSRFHDVHVVQTKAPGETHGQPPEGVRLHSLASRETPTRRRALFDVLRKVRPDIVHLVQSPYCYDDVMMLQPVFSEASWCLDFRSPHIGAPDAPALANYHDMQLQIDCLLTHSMESLRTNLPNRYLKAIEIPPGVDMAAIQDATANGPDVRREAAIRRLVYVGSLSRTRKMDLLLQMFAKALSSNKGLTLDIYGQGNAEEHLQNLARELGVEDHVFFRGMLDQSELWKRLTGYDAGIAYVPEEMFGTAPSLKSIEYAAVGLPVLASDTEGHRAFAGRFGFDFDLFRNTPEGLHEALTANRKTAWDKKRLDANIAASQALDWERVVIDRLMPVYRQLRA